MLAQISYLVLVPCMMLVGSLGLRRLYTMFLEEGLALYSDLTLQPESTMIVGARVAIRNGLILAPAALAFVAFGLLRLPWPAMAAPGVIGVLAALAVTIHVIRESLQVDTWLAGLLGLVCFAGGNLPLIVLVAIMLAAAGLR